MNNNILTTTMSTDLLKSIPIPTIDRPFGIEVWTIFDKLYTAINGYHPEDFKFKPDITAMSTLKETATMITAYYVIIFAGREFMRNRRASKLNGLFMIHNL